jgi:hypothetical protein
MCIYRGRRGWLPAYPLKLFRVLKINIPRRSYRPLSNIPDELRDFLA